MVRNENDNEVEIKLNDLTSTYEKILSNIGIKEAKDEIIKDTKVTEFLNYIINCKDELKISEEELDINSFLYMVKNIKSFDVLLHMLNDTLIRKTMVYHLEEIVEWYNVYNPQKIRWYAREDAKLLLDEEYLKVATVDWTENSFFQLDSYFYYENGEYKLESSSIKPNDFGYIPPFYENVHTLNEEKRKGRLDKAINFLIDSTLKK